MRTKHFLIALAVALTPTIASAQTYTDTVAHLRYTLSGTSATITGPEAGYTTGALKIPYSVTDGSHPGTVVAIGNNAFAHRSSFTGPLTLPNSVTSIGQSAFVNCSGLTGDLTIPNSVTSIGSAAFEYCSGFTGSLTLPSKLTSIGSSVFQGCSGFTGALTLPNGVTSIGGSAFHGCSGLTGPLTLPSKLTRIGIYAFEGCSGFTGSLIIPNRVTTILHNAFYGCSGLTGDLSIPNSVTSIGDAAFYGCKIRSVTMNSSTISMFDYGLFTGCTSLEYIDMTGVQTTYQTFSLSRATSTAYGHVFSDLPAHTVVYLPQGTPDSLIANSAPNNMNYVRLDKSGVEQCPWLYVQDGCDYYLPHAFTAARATWNAAGTGAETTPNATRTLAAGGYATAYLPYEFTMDGNNVKGYSLSYKDNHKPTVGTDNTLVFTQNTTGRYLANTPYVIRAVSGGAFPEASDVSVPATPVSRVTYAPGGTAGYDGATTAVDNLSGGEPVDDPVSGAWGFYGSTERIPAGLWQSLGWNAHALGGGSWHPLTGDLGQMRAFIVGNGTPLTSKPAFTLANADGTRDTTTSIDGLTVTGGDGATRVYNLGGQYVGDDINSLPGGMYVVNGKKVIK